MKMFSLHSVLYCVLATDFVFSFNLNLDILLAVTLSLIFYHSVSEGEWSNECEPIQFDEVLSKGNVNKGIAKFIYRCRLFILFIPMHCGYYVWVSGQGYNCFRRRNLDSWVESTFDNYTCMYVIQLFTLRLKTVVTPLRNPAWYAGYVKLVNTKWKKCK